LAREFSRVRTDSATELQDAIRTRLAASGVVAETVDVEVEEVVRGMGLGFARRTVRIGAFPIRPRPRAMTPRSRSPRVTIARSLSNTFAGKAPGVVAAFIAAQSLGMLAAVGLGRWLWCSI
jgi:hypothetical protein